MRRWRQSFRRRAWVTLCEGVRERSRLLQACDTLTLTLTLTLILTLTLTLTLNLNLTLALTLTLTLTLTRPATPRRAAGCTTLRRRRC